MKAIWNGLAKLLASRRRFSLKEPSGAPAQVRPAFAVYLGLRDDKDPSACRFPGDGRAR